jgi:hypothetical protein
LDGILLAAYLSNDGDIEISEINAAPMYFSYRSQNYNDSDFVTGEPTEKNYRVDVVCLSELPNYLELCKRRQMRILDAINQKLLELS